MEADTADWCTVMTAVALNRPLDRSVQEVPMSQTRGNDIKPNLRVQKNKDMGINISKFCMIYKYFETCVL